MGFDDAMTAVPLILATALTLGCATPVASVGPSFRPDPARRVSSSGLSVELVRAYVRPGSTQPLTDLGVDLRFESASPAVLAAVSLADSHSAPCAEGTVAREVQTGPLTKRPLPLPWNGDQLVRVEFHRSAEEGGLRGAGSALDVTVEQGGGRSCLRIAFVDLTGAVGWRPAFDGFFGLSARLDSMVGGAGTESAVGVLVGRWFSPRSRVWLEPAIASLSGLLQPSVSLGAHAEWVFLHVGKFALGVSGGYVVRAAWSRSTAGVQWLHGPEAALRFKLVHPPEPGASGFPGSVPLGSWELVVPVGYRFGGSLETRPERPVAGLGLVLNLE